MHQSLKHCIVYAGRKYLCLTCDVYTCICHVNIFVFLCLGHLCCGKLHELQCFIGDVRFSRCTIVIIIIIPITIIMSMCSFVVRSSFWHKERTAYCNSILTVFLL